MKFVKGISLFFVLPVAILAVGVWIGVKMTHFFYPGEQKLTKESVVTEEEKSLNLSDTAQKSVTQVSSDMETLSVDTEYVLEEMDIVTGSVVETVWRLPDKYVGLNREQFIDAMENFEMFPPLSELERGFVNLEVLSFARERVVVQMNYQYMQPSISFYLAVRNNEVVVYLDDCETIYISTGISLNELPEEVQLELMQMIWVEDEENLYHFLETYSS